MGVWIACGVIPSLNFTSTGAPDMCCNVCCVHVLNALELNAERSHSFRRGTFFSVAMYGSESGRSGGSALRGQSHFPPIFFVLAVAVAAPLLSIGNVSGNA